MQRAGVFSAVILTFGALGPLLAAEAGKVPSKLERCSCFQTEAIHEFDRIFLAGQPTPGGFAEAQKAGVRTVVNLRAASELNWDEKAHVEGLGMKYIHVPIPSSEAMTDEIFAQLRDLLKDNSRRPILVHCFSAGRVAQVGWRTASWTMDSVWRRRSRKPSRLDCARRITSARQRTTSSGCKPRASRRPGRRLPTRRHRQIRMRQNHDHARSKDPQTWKSFLSSASS